MLQFLKHKDYKNDDQLISITQKWVYNADKNKQHVKTKLHWL